MHTYNRLTPFNYCNSTFFHVLFLFHFRNKRDGDLNKHPELDQSDCWVEFTEVHPEMNEG